MTDRKSTLTAVLVDQVSGTAKTISAEIRGIGQSVTAVGQIFQGIGQGIGQAISRVFGDAIRTVSGLIPDLLDQGHAYLDTLHQIQLETGMTAEQTSLLTGSFRALGVPIDNISQLFARFGQNLATNEARFAELGIATRDQNGAMLSAYTIFQNVRRAVQEHGASLLTTSVAQELFGRSGYKVIEALQASDAEWAAATENVRRWGGVVSQAAIDGADRLQDTLSSLGQGITDIGTNIAAALDPYLRSFVEAFSRFVQAHLDEIVQFAVNVVNTVIGFISGLFGITASLDTSAGSVAKSAQTAGNATEDWGKKLAGAKTGSDAFTDSINRQIKAIDAQIAKVDEAAQRRRAAAERVRLADSLAAAQAQLKDLRGASPFLGGLSAAEQALAVQKHAQDIIDAEKNVQDQRQAIGDFEADQKDRAETELLRRQKDRLQERLAAHRAADQEILSSGLRAVGGLDTGATTVFSDLTAKAQAMGASAAGAFKTGYAAAQSFLEVLIGADRYDSTTNTHTRVGGVVGAIGAVGSALGNLGISFGNVVGAIATVEGWLNGLQSFLVNAGISIHNFIVGFVDSFRRALLGLPATGGYNNGGIIPKRNLAEGGIVKARPGGTIVRAAEAGEDELFLPLSKARGGGGDIHFHFDFLSMPSRDQIRELVREVNREMTFQSSASPFSSLGSGVF